VIFLGCGLTGLQFVLLAIGQCPDHLRCAAAREGRAALMEAFEIG